MRACLGIAALVLWWFPVWAGPEGDPESAPGAAAAEVPAPGPAALPDPASVLAGSDDATLPLPQRVALRWWDLRESLASPTADVEGKIAELQKLRETSGLKGLPGPARALVVDGFRLLDEGDRPSAQARFHAATELDPMGADGRLALAVLARRESSLTPAWVGALINAARLRATALRSAPFALAGWLLLVVLGLLVAGLGALVALFVRHQGLFRHDVEERLKQRFEPEIAVALAWVVALLPILLTFDLFWACLYWTVMVWAYFRPREQAVAVAGLLFAALLIPGLGTAARMISGTNEPYPAAAAAYLEGMVDEPQLEALENWLAQHPDDTDAAILRALIYEKNGDRRPAVQFWKQLAGRTNSAVAWNNLGNVHHRLDERDNALEAWNRALEADPRFATTHYNLHRFYTALLDFKKAEEHFAEAKAIDARAVDRWVRDGAGIVDAGVDRARIRQLLLGGGTRPPAVRAATAPSVLGAIAAIVAGFALGRVRRRGTVAQACDRCGQAFCRRCKPGKDKSALCLQCVHLFLRKDGVSPQMRSDKMKEIAGNQRRRRIASIALGALAPGAGQVYARRPLAGFGLLVLWGLALVAWRLHGRLPFEPGLVGRATTAWPEAMSLAVVVSIWLWANAANLLRKA